MLYHCPGELPRTIHSLSDGEKEIGLSRIYGGVHFPFDINPSNQLGRKVSAWVLANGPHKNK
jgi:hypothetical protein